MRVAKIEGSVVVNVELWPEGADLPSGYVASDSANIGDTYEGGEFIAPPVPEVQE